MPLLAPGIKGADWVILLSRAPFPRPPTEVLNGLRYVGCSRARLLLHVIDHG